MQWFVVKYRKPDGTMNRELNLNTWNQAVDRFEVTYLWPKGKTPGFDDRDPLQIEPSIIFVPAQGRKEKTGTIIVACGGGTNWAQRLVAARAGSPLVLGLGDGGARYLASDALALAGVCSQAIYLRDGDVASLTLGAHQVLGADGQPAERPAQPVPVGAQGVELGAYRHYMQKEIFEQPRAIADNTWEVSIPANDAVVLM